MQKLIAFLLRKYTPFRVTAWAFGEIAGIGFYPGPGQLFKRPTIEELEKILNSEEPSHIIIAPDGSISAVGNQK